MQDQDNDAIQDFVESLFRILAMLSAIEQQWLDPGNDNWQERLDQRLSDLDSHLPGAGQALDRHGLLFPDADRVMWTSFDSSYSYCQEWRGKVQHLLETSENFSVENVRNLAGLEEFESWKYDLRKAIKLRVQEEFPNCPASRMQRIIDQASFRLGIPEEIHNVRLGVTVSSHPNEIGDEFEALVKLAREAIAKCGRQAKFVDIAKYIRKKISVSNDRLVVVLDYLRQNKEYDVKKRRRKSDFPDQSELALPGPKVL